MLGVLLAQVGLPDANTSIAIVALIGLAGFTGWLLRDYIADLKAQRTRLESLLSNSIDALEHLADELEKQGVKK